MSSDEHTNNETFRECLSEVIIRKLAQPAQHVRRRAPKGRKGTIKPVVQASPAKDEKNANDAEELGEFIEVYIHMSQMRSAINLTNWNCVVSKY